MTEEGLWFQAWMIGNFPLVLRRAFTFDDIFKRIPVWSTAQPARLEYLQTITDFHSVWNGFAKNTPRFVAASRQRTNVREFFLRVLWSITASQCFD